MSEYKCANHAVAGRHRMTMLTSACVLIFIVMNAITSLAQQRTVSGRVTDASTGQALPGVNVVVEKTGMGTVTDNDGRYSLVVPETESLIVFSFVGFKTLKIPAEQLIIVDAQLSVDVTQLSEIVITALGLTADRDKVGASSTQVSGEKVVRSGEPTLINGLSGKSSGLLISRTSGDPGAGSYIQIRGQSSIINSVQPLIVVDGVPVYNSNFGTFPAGFVEQSRLNDINPNDIESVEVLKGASASALWGTRAGNGVIMITTRKGKNTGRKVNIEYAGIYSIDELLVKHPLQNTYGQGSGGRYISGVFGPRPGNPNSFGDKIANRPGGPDSVRTDVGYFQNLDSSIIYPILEAGIDTTVYGGKRSNQTYDPYDAIIGTGCYYDQTLSLSGGNHDGNYFVSIGDLNQQGIIRNNSNYRRTSIRVNSEKQMTDWLRLSSNLMYSRLMQQGVMYGNSTAAIMLGALRTPPDWNNAKGYEGVFYDLNGTASINRQLAYRNQFGQHRSPGYENPVWSMNNDRHTTEVDRFIGSLRFQIEPTEWLRITARGGLDHYSDRWVNYFHPGGVMGANGSGVLGLLIFRETQFNFDGFIEGRFKVANAWRVNALLGFNANQRALDGLFGSAFNFVIQANPPQSLDNATLANDDAGNQFEQVRSSAGYATANLEFDDQLFLGLTARLENSSVFSHSDNPLFLYPSISAAWHPLKTLHLVNNTISFIKVRAGYGVVSTTPGPYETVTYWTPAAISDGFTRLSAGASIYGGGYQQSTTLGNNNLKPETKSEVEGGIDLRFLHDRISLSATYFSNRVKDAIIPAAMAGSTGFTNRNANAAGITNRGIELDGSGDVVRIKKLIWNLYANWTWLRNKVTSLGGHEVVTFSDALLGDGGAVVNHPVGVFYGTAYERSENGLELDQFGFPKVSATATVLGDPNPDWRLGIGTNLRWKNLSLNALVEHSHGGQIWGATRGALIAFGTHKDTDREVTLNYQQADTIRNAIGETPIQYGYPMNADSTFTIRGYLHDFGGGTVLIDEEWWKGKGGGFAGPDEPFIEPARWTKLREISLTYSLNGSKFQKRTKLQSIDFTITGRNLFLWTDFIGNDPETNLRGPANTRGRDYFNNPATRSYLLTIRINY